MNATPLNIFGGGPGGTGVLPVSQDRQRQEAIGSGSDLAASQRSFLSVLGKHVDEPTSLSPEQHARQVAEQMVSISMIQPMLKQLRSTNNAAPPFAPTEGEKQFRALTDADLAQNIVHAKHFPLVDTLAQFMLKRGETLASGESVQDELGKARTPDRPTPPGGTSVAR